MKTTVHTFSCECTSCTFGYGSRPAPAPEDELTTLRRVRDAAERVVASRSDQGTDSVNWDAVLSDRLDVLEEALKAAAVPGKGRGDG